jgi:hypothetical protein
MTTPTTAEIRAWARGQGMDVGDRGRLSPQIRAASHAAHGGTGTGKPVAPTKVAAASTRRTSATTARSAADAGPAAKKAAAGRRAAARSAPPAQRPEQPADQSAARDAQPDPVVAQGVLNDDPRVDDLERKLSELARRVAQLERAAAAPPPRRVFRRRG